MTAEDRKKIPYIGGEATPGTFVEMIYRPDDAETLFAVWRDGEVQYRKSMDAGGGQTLVPYSARNNLVSNRIVLFPSNAVDYGTEEALVSEITSFIHRYVDLSPTIERVAAYYVLFTWVYDGFNELPYLRFRGDYGFGKTRALLTVGSICFRPIFASGASTVSPIFRLLDIFKGTLVIDEGDFRVSDEKAELVKIFNNGNARGFPVLRAEATGNGKEFNPVAYMVFGPKIVASRGFFQDRALESRFITEEMGTRQLRQDIPINLPAVQTLEATQIRNKLLMFRFRSLQRGIPEPTLMDRNLEPRLNQVFSPLLSMMNDQDAKNDLLALANDFQVDINSDRGWQIEARVLEVIFSLRATTSATEPTINMITKEVNERYAAEFDRTFTPHYIGRMIRQNLGLRTRKGRAGYVIPDQEHVKLERLFEKYGTARPPSDAASTQ